MAQAAEGLAAVKGGLDIYQQYNQPINELLNTFGRGAKGAGGIVVDVIKASKTPSNPQQQQMIPQNGFMPQQQQMISPYGYYPQNGFMPQQQPIDPRMMAYLSNFPQYQEPVQYIPQPQPRRLRQEQLQPFMNYNDVPVVSPYYNYPSRGPTNINRPYRGGYTHKTPNKTKSNKNNKIALIDYIHNVSLDSLLNKFSNTTAKNTKNTKTTKNTKNTKNTKTTSVKASKKPSKTQAKKQPKTSSKTSSKTQSKKQPKKQQKTKITKQPKKSYINYTKY